MSKKNKQEKEGVKWEDYLLSASEILSVSKYIFTNETKFSDSVYLNYKNVKEN